LGWERIGCGWLKLLDVRCDGKDVFQKWLDELVDQRARVLIDKTVAKVRLGNLGQHKSVGAGVQEIVLDLRAGLPNLLR
jgi:putative addiction module killer protein